MKSPCVSTCVLEFYSTILVLNVFYGARIPKETFPSSIGIEEKAESQAFNGCWFSNPTY